MKTDFLLSLYRLARESGPAEFQPAVVQLLQRSLDFDMALWAAGNLQPGGGLILDSAHIHNVDPAFLTEWSGMNRRDRAVDRVFGNPGRAQEIRVPSFYAPEPECTDIAARYEMGFYTATSQVDGKRCEWLALYNADPDTNPGSRTRAWIEFILPHICEARRIHRVIHPMTEGHPYCDDEFLAVADRQTGVLLNEEPRFRAAVADEWHEFSGCRLPAPIHRLLKERDRLVFRGRKIVVQGHCTAGLAMLTVRLRTGAHAMSSRQLEIARVYAQGLSHKEIAAKLQLSPATVRNHLAGVYAALGVHSRRQMVSALQTLER